MNDAAARGSFCGRVTYMQLQAGRHFVAEKPHPSALFDEPPWPEVLKSPGVVTTLLDPCMTRQRFQSGESVRKPTLLVA